MMSKRWMVFDMETDSFDGKKVEPFIFGVVYDNGDEFFTYSRTRFIDTIRGFDGLALAHNGGKFDTLFLVDQFNIGQEIKIINGRVAEVKIGKATVRDSFLIIPAPLAASGLKDDFDYKILARDKKHLRKINKEKIEAYLMQDCRALATLVHTFYERFGQRLTQAGAALATWEGMGGLKRRWGGKHDKFFRQFYYGGRCEAFQKGALGDGWEYFDIKSAYPYAMKHEHTACNLNEYGMHRKIAAITPQSFARIIAASAGCLPVRGQYVTEYPHHTDQREYFATGWEILAGLETGTLKIFEATIYEPDNVETLAPYVDKFYADKLAAEKEGNQVNRLIAKIFLNSLYGKFGQCADDFVSYKIVECEERPEGYKYYMDCDDFDIVRKPAGGQFFDVALSASITGFVRAMMWRQRCAAVSAGCEVAYMDTDSNMVRGNTDKIYAQGENIGQWEKVCTLDDLHIAGKKLYAGFDGKAWVTAHKGFSRLDTGFEDVIKAAKGDKIIIARSAPSINVLGEQSFISRTMRKT